MLRLVLVAACGAKAFASDDCFVDASVCGVRPFEACLACEPPADPKTGCCYAKPTSADVDCYKLGYSVCGEEMWCQLNDHKSFNETESTTIGRCLPYQLECESCVATFSSDEKLQGFVIPGLSARAFYSEQYDPRIRSTTHGRQLGTYLSRRTTCNPNKNLVCTGVSVPSLPATCVQARTKHASHQMPTRSLVQSWAKRMLRMGARNFQNSKPGMTPQSQQPQGVPREEIWDGVNFILGTLWNHELWGPYEVLDVSSTYGEACCTSAEYRAGLSPWQANRTGAEYRNPVHPTDPERGNAPPCVWCQYDGAYNDENPAVWSLLHALTFNLNDTITEPQFQVLQALPLWLKEHLSCALCRSHISEHLIGLGVPTDTRGVTWARYFWKAHNYVNEQSEVTRCGSQSCGWGIWQTPPANKCAGVYRYPWFMPFADATTSWRIFDPKDGSRGSWAREADTAGR
jgi:hypothetical protein